MSGKSRTSPRIWLGLAVLLVSALATAGPAAAATHYFAPVREHRATLVFKLGGLDPSEVRGAYVKAGAFRLEVSVERMRSAARRGTLRVHLPKRAQRKPRHSSHRMRVHRSALSSPTLVVTTADTTTTAPTATTLTADAVSTFRPEADAYVIANRKKNNFGSASELRVNASPVARSYLRFAVQGLANPVVRATLKLYATGASSAGFDVRSVSDSSWGERSINYVNSPAVGSVAGSSGSLGGAGWVSVDVTSLVKSDGAVGFALTTSSGSATQSSREVGASSPQLVVETGTAPAPTPLPDPNPLPDPTPSPTPIPGFQPSFPIRAAFYYPWFPETWTLNGALFTKYHPTLGLYDSSSTSVIQQHVRAMEYGGVQVGISSWWGQAHTTDVRFPTILNTTASMGSNFRWSLYYEKESLGDPSVSELASDLAYIRDHYGSDPAYFRANGRFVVFVYADGADSCGMADRWRQANAGINAYIVLKVFSGYRLCLSQPDGWHQYSPAVATDSQSGYSYSISPGFNKANEATPRLGRDLSRWNQNVRDMVASNAPFQLVVSFDEWGEGTAVESATEWASPSGYGDYLDALHANGQSATQPPALPPPPTNLPPTASFTASPNPATTTETVTFNGSGSSDTDGSITNYKWDLDGNGSFETDTGSSATTSRSYSSAGSVTVKLRVTDSAGATGDATKTLTVNAPASPPPSPPPPPSSGDPVIAAAGDIACASSTVSSGSCHQQATSDLLVNQGLAGVLTLGDNQYDSGTASDFQSFYDPAWGRVKSLTFPSPGNHDPPGSGYTSYFGRPAYYSYDIGSWHLISLNSNSVDSTQLNWLESDLASHPTQCTLAYWHHPRFSSGSTHGNNTSVGPFWDRLYAANADVILNGHEHNYERFGPQTPAGAADSARGVRQFVAGTGGRNRYAMGVAKPNSEVRNASTYGVLKLTLHSNGYDWTFTPESGSSFSDTGSASCH